MSDNTRIWNRLFRTDKIAGVHYPIHKIAYGGNDDATLISESAPLPVVDDTLPTTMFNEALTTQRTNIIEIKSQTNVVSDLRNVTAATNTASVSIANSEFVVSTGATASSTATLDSAERGRYIPGYAAECGIGVRLPDTNVFAGTAAARWGYFNDDNGFGYGKDATGLFVFIRRGGTETKTYQSAWSKDKLDGTGASGLTLDANRGNIYEINYSWYGYGNIAFHIVVPDATYRQVGQRVVSVHVIAPDAETSIRQPNLPIRAEITNGDQTTDYDMYVGGRQYSIIGQFNPNRRITTHTVLNKSLAAASGFQHVMSFRRKSTGSYTEISAKVAFVQLLSDQNAIYRLKTNATLTSPSWNTPSGRTGTAGETALEVDVAATVSGGVVLFEGILDGGSRNDASMSTLLGEDYNFDMIENEPLTLEVDTLVNGTLEAAILGMREDW